MPLKGLSSQAGLARVGAFQPGGYFLWFGFGGLWIGGELGDGRRRGVEGDTSPVPDDCMSDIVLSFYIALFADVGTAVQAQKPPATNGLNVAYSAGKTRMS